MTKRILLLATVAVALAACGRNTDDMPRPPRQIPTPLPGPVSYSPVPTPALPALELRTCEEFEAELASLDDADERDALDIATIFGLERCIDDISLYGKYEVAE